MNEQNHEMANHIARSLLNIEAVSLSPNEPFTWTSGMISPIYCDNRLTMGFPKVREAIAQGFTELILQKYPQVEVIAGTATAGIPHAAWVAQKLNLPMIYIRDKVKGHGKKNQIEGPLHTGQKIILIEDLISTGGSAIKAAQAAEAEGAHVLGVLAIVTYEFPIAQKLFQEQGIELSTLSSYSLLIETARMMGRITPAEVKLLKKWRNDPGMFKKD